MEPVPFFPLQAVDHITRIFVKGEGLEVLVDSFHPPGRPAVVIFVVALDEPLRQTIEQPGTSADRCQLVSHVHSSRWKVKCVSSPLARWRAHVRAPEATALREPRPNSPDE